jgi:nucleoside 2-deoxyribosyltransferase
MIICLCASLKVHHQIINLKHQLEVHGHQVILPKTTNLIYQGKLLLKDLDKHKLKHSSENVVKHFDNIKKADVILVVNSTRKKIKNYIGGNTLIEMGFAYYLKKPIYLLNSIPKLSYSEEIRAVKPIILQGELSKINA